MASKILIIEDVKEIADLVALYITNAGMESLVCTTAEVALSSIKDTKIDLVLLDLNLPGMSGFEFLKIFRKEYKATIPVIIVSARDADEDIIQGFGIGADDFVTKPFSPKVLVARVQAILRRQAATEAAVEASFKFGDFTILENSCVLKHGSEKIPLSTKEYEVLAYFAHNKDKVLSPENIYNDVWKNQYGDITAVAVYVQRLRKKIEENPVKPKYIKTVFGLGYKFETGNTL